MNTDEKRMPTVYPPYIRFHPRLILVRRNKSISPKFQETETAWPLLKGRAIAFVPTKLGRG